MALYKDHYIELDTKRSPRISLQNIIEGETGNRLFVALINNDTAVNLATKENGSFIYRVVLRVDSDLGTRYQDSDVTGDGVTRVESGDDSGKACILLKPGTFAAGLNRGWLKVYSTQTTEQDRMIYSAEFQFTVLRDDSDGANSWHRGSTPTHSMEVPIDLTDALIEVSYEQHGNIVCRVYNEQMTITPTKLTWALTSDDTLAMEVGDIYIQLHYKTLTMEDHSDIHHGKVLYTQGV